MKNELIEKLKNDVVYREALKAVKNTDDRKKIMYITESFLNDFQNSLSSLKEKIATNPELVQELRMALSQKETKDVGER